MNLWGTSRRPTIPAGHCSAIGWTKWRASRFRADRGSGNAVIATSLRLGSTETVAALAGTCCRHRRIERRQRQQGRQGIGEVAADGDGGQWARTSPPRRRSPSRSSPGPRWRGQRGAAPRRTRNPSRRHVSDGRDQNARVSLKALHFSPCLHHLAQGFQVA
jgi:hypothetical protein